MSAARPARSVALAVLVVGALALVDCSGLSQSNSDLPEPLIAAGAASRPCTAPPAGITVTLDVVGTSVTTDFPGSRPIARADVFGSVTGIGPTDLVIVAAVPLGDDCPIETSIVATVDAAGAFTARLDIDDATEMRIVAMVGPAASAASCDPNASDCLQLVTTPAPGTPVTPLAVSNTIEIRLD